MIVATFYLLAAGAIAVLAYAVRLWRRRPHRSRILNAQRVAPRLERVA